MHERFASAALALTILPLATLLMIAPQVGGAESPGETAFSLVVMDPLAAPLSCPCVEGYAQRKYEVLGEHLEAALGRPVTVTFAESLRGALAKDNCDHADLIIGKDSVVRSDGTKAGYKLTPLARLTDMEGVATQTGLVVVRSGDPARKIKDLAGYRILYGPADCDEKFAAPRKLLTEAGVKVLDAGSAETASACSDGACKILEWGDAEQAAAVISSYAAPLLEGCGTIEKGDLRVVGESAPVPFITAFVTNRVSAEAKTVVRDVLLNTVNEPDLLVALESTLGFIEPDEAYLKANVLKEQEPAKGAALPDRSTSWPGFLGPTRDGRVDWLPDTLPERPEALWRQPLLFPGMGGIAATEDFVILGDRDASDSLDVWRCYSAADGSELWSVEHPATGKLDYDNQPRATPVIDGDLVYLCGAFGDLLCVEVATGAMLWHVNLRFEFGAEYELIWGTCATPLLVDGKLIVAPGAPDASLAALDAQTGEVVWLAPGEKHAYASPILATLGGVQQIVTYDRESLGGWDPETGERLWSLKPPLDGDFNVPTPVVVDGKLLVVSENNGARLHAFDDSGRIDPDPVARYAKLRPDMSTPVVVGDRVFCVSDQLYCLDAESLAKKWIGGRRLLPSYGPVLASPTRLLTVAKGGDLLLLGATAKKFEILSHAKPFPENQGTQIFGCPALVGERLYLRGEKELVCLSLQNAS